MKKKLIFIAVGIALLGAFYYFVYPVFRVVERNDALPEVSSDSQPVGSASPSSSQTAHTPSEEKTRAYEIVATPAHPASGTVKIIESGGKAIVRFENLETIDGPDLHIYLSKDKEAKEFVDLGEIRATRGNVNYEVPGGVNIEDYTYILAWCKPFGVLFHYANISQ